MTYDLVRRGEIKSVEIHGALRVPAKAIEDFAIEVETAAGSVDMAM
jgi:hypothetical protein